jgi:hypothetical protein
MNIIQNLLIGMIVLQVISMVKPSEMIDYLMLIVLFVTAYTYEHIAENFVDTQSPFCSPCPKEQSCPECPPCEGENAENRQWDLPRWSYVDPEGLTKSQLRPALCANPVETKTDYYTPTDYTEFLTAFDNTRVGANLPREKITTDYL